jgi:hypothetical protein
MHAILDQDLPGIDYLFHVRRFFTELVPFPNLRPAPALIVGDNFPFGSKPLALATADRSTIAVYLPTGGEVRLRLPGDGLRTGHWFDPRRGVVAQPAEPIAAGAYVAPGEDEERRPADWVLVLPDA